MVFFFSMKYELWQYVLSVICKAWHPVISNYYICLWCRLLCYNAENMKAAKSWGGWSMYMVLKGEVNLTA